MPPTRVLLGTELLAEEHVHLIAGRRLGLITNPSGVNGALQATADRLHECAGTELVALFGPEHGIRGDAADGVPVAAARDRRTGLSAFSLYGDVRAPSEAMLENVDVVLFDIQDVGVRFYTYLYTMSMSMAACAVRGVPFVVLDRPNPIGGEILEGNRLDPAFATFVGRYPIPIRYGMTVGELARLFNQAFAIGVELHVVEMRGWHRALYWDETGLPWVPPSPNMPTPETAVVYPGMCFLEGTNVSEGRGTSKPFEQVGAPYVDGERLADRLNALELPGVFFRPVYFQPSAGKWVDERCQGIQVHVLNRRIWRPVRAGLEVVGAIRELWPTEFAWRIPRGGIHNFDSLAGTDRIRKALDRGTPPAELVAGWDADLQHFRALREHYLLY